MSNDEIGPALMKLWLARMLEGESQIAENITWDRETKAGVPFAQALTLAAGIGAVLVGLVLFGWVMGWLLEWELTAGDVLLVGIGGVALLMVMLAVARLVVRTSNQAVRVGFAVFFAVVLSAGVAGALTAARERLDAIHGIGLLLAPVFLVPGLALTYRQLIDLVDPFGKTSPVERMMYPYLGRLFGGEGQAKGKKRLEVPYRLNGQVPIRNDGGTPPPAGDGGVVVGLAPEDADLVDFVKEAGKRGLARRKWLVKGQANYVLAGTRTEVGRDTFDDMIEQCAQWGFVSPGGDGKRAHWLMPVARCVEVLEGEMWGQLVDLEEIESGKEVMDHG